ncbi:SdpA family antimicrobial peptide system protein [Streptomyces sp. NPDC056309]|uniref:SdpA family antimicrobial peptide system protein n=1 Tax=unclassified Streptomyces TaxID=2593676 RepID=UPI0035DE3100
MPEQVRRTAADDAADKGAPDGRRDRMGKLLIAVAAFWALVGGYILHTQLPSNAVQLPAQQSLERTIRVVTPQGWAFFTKSPRDPKIVAWARGSDGSWRNAMLAPHSEPRNLFGLNRASRAQGIELGQLQARVKPDSWAPCEDGVLAECLAEFSNPITVRTPVPEPQLCGPVGITQQEVLPWAWSDSEGKMEMPGKVAVLEVEC